LEGLLNSHPSIKVYNEIFHGKNSYADALCPKMGFSDFMCDSKITLLKSLRLRFGWPPRNSSEMHWMRKNTPGRFLEQCLAKPEPLPVKIIGFKTQPWQVNVWYSEKQKAELAQVVRKRFKIIYLERQNALEQFVSLLVARKLDDWRLQKNQSIPLLESRRIEVRPDDFLNFVKKREVKMLKMRALFKGACNRTVFYEDIVGPDMSALENIQQFLGVEVMSLSPKDLKGNPEPVDQRILNYSELKARLARTPAAIYLPDV
jgi:hypothetical protein